eukprot:2548981-Prymnesium_polylepis.1
MLLTRARRRSCTRSLPDLRPYAQAQHWWYRGRRSAQVGSQMCDCIQLLPCSDSQAPPMIASRRTFCRRSAGPPSVLIASGGERRSSARLVSMPTDEMTTDWSG